MEMKPPGTAPFTLSTTDHDDAKCLTAGYGNTATPKGGALRDPPTEKEAEMMFPLDSDPSMSAGYRSAYAQSEKLMEQIEERRERLNKQCNGEYGAPQGPLGEIYSTHTTVAQISEYDERADASAAAAALTWRYVVGVQLSGDYNVSAHDVALPLSGKRFSYRYDDLHTFKPRTAADLHAVTAERVLTLHKSDGAMCATAPAFKITTRCFPFEWHAVAPVASNGWVLTGEVGKLIPISNQRVASIRVLSLGGFMISVKGKAGEAVTFGAVAPAKGGAVNYATATIGSSGTAEIMLK